MVSGIRMASTTRIVRAKPGPSPRTDRGVGALIQRALELLGRRHDVRDVVAVGLVEQDPAGGGELGGRAQRGVAGRGLELADRRRHAQA